MAQTAAQKRAAEAKKRRQRADKRQQYGFVDDFLKANPGIKKLVDQAIKDGLTPAAFEGRLKNTKWYKSRTEAQRQWDKNAYDDPAENARLQEKSRIALVAAAKAAGVSPTKTQLDTWSKTAARNGWTDGEYQAKLASIVNVGTNPADATLTGQVGKAYDEIRQMAAAYGVPTSATKINEQIQAVVGGTAQAEDYTDHYRELAKAQYGSIANLLDQGMTVMDVLDPYLQAAAGDLGVTVAQIMEPGSDGYMSDMWTAAIQGDKAMTMAEWQRLVRTDARYGYARTAKAKTEAAAVGQRIAQMFGKG